MVARKSAEARALLTLRTNAGLGQKDLAARSGVHNATISSYERGRRSIGATNLQALLVGLGVPNAAWEVTVRLFVWLDRVCGDDSSKDLTVEDVAESLGREVEWHVAALLRAMRSPQVQPGKQR